MTDERLKMLVAAICESGVDDYRAIIRRTIKAGDVSEQDVRLLRELDKDMPEWLGYLPTVDMTWDQIKQSVLKSEVNKR